MKYPLIKICGIKHPSLITQMEGLGVDFIGIIFHPASKRYVDLATAQKISTAAKQHGIIPVAVFVEHTAQEMQAICLATQIEWVQLHGEKSKKEHHLLPEHYRRIYVQTVESNVTLSPDISGGLYSCRADRDFLLFDNVQGGSGRAFDWKRFHYHAEFRWFLAGGLTSATVSTAIGLLHPDGVDVSGGVENEQGEKEIGLIREFVEQVQ